MAFSESLASVSNAANATVVLESPILLGYRLYTKPGWWLIMLHHAKSGRTREDRVLSHIKERICEEFILTKCKHCQLLWKFFLTPKFCCPRRPKSIPARQIFDASSICDVPISHWIGQDRRTSKCFPPAFRAQMSTPTPASIAWTFPNLISCVFRLRQPFLFQP